MGGSWTVVSKGQSIGNKRIHILDKALSNLSALRLRITGLAAASGIIKSFDAFAPCDDGDAAQIIV